MAHSRSFARDDIGSTLTKTGVSAKVCKNEDGESELDLLRKKKMTVVTNVKQTMD